MKDYDGELRKINDELLSIDERKDFLVNKRTALKLRHIYPYEIVYPITIPFGWFITSITHMKKEECSRICLDSVVQRGTTSVYLTGSLPISMKFKHIFVPKIKGMKRNTHLMKGRFIIEGIVPRPSSMKYLCDSCSKTATCWMIKDYGKRDSCGSYEEVTDAKETEEE